MKKASFRARVRYWFDNVMAKGTGPLILMLLGITATVVVLIGMLAFFLNRGVFGSLGNSIWQNLMHAIDAGALAGLGVDSGPLFIALMTITTICGIFITSMLIGIINSGLESKFASLRKGNSKVIETDHTVVLGFDSRVFTTLSELILANENRKKPRIVVLGNEDKEAMDEAMRNYLGDHKNTVIICRSGDTADTVSLARCSVETCRSIIVNETSDAKTIRTILAVTNYLKAFAENTAHITAVVYEEDNVDVAKIAGEGRVEVLFFVDAMARIIAHTCRQPGLSCVYTELFAFAGNEIYMEAIPALSGKTFGEALTLLPEACLIGIKRDGKAMVNPPMNTRLAADDAMIVIAADDGVVACAAAARTEDVLMVHGKITEPEQPDSLLVLGQGKLLSGIVEELDRYVGKGSRVTVVCEDAAALAEAEALRETLQHMTLRTEQCAVCNRAALERLVGEGYRNVVVLSDMQGDAEAADATTLMVLMHLRDIARKTNAVFSITSEMRDVRNQELAHITNVNDFVVSANLTSLMTAQVSENRLLAAVFSDLLDEEGSEIYVKPARNYVVTGKPVDCFTVTRAAADRNEVFIGYKDVTRTADGTETVVRLNPPKAETITFDADDKIIVIAED